MARNDKRKAPPAHRTDVGLEGASENDAGIIRRAEVEGGEEVSIGGGPPSGAGGSHSVSVPTPDEEHDPQRRS